MADSIDKHEGARPVPRPRRETPTQDGSRRSRDWLTYAGIAFLTLVLLAKFVFVRHEILSPGAVRNVGLLVDFALVGVVVGLISLTRRPLWWGLLADAIVSLTLFAAVIYVGYNDQLPQLRMLGMANQLGEVKDSILDLIAPWQLLLAADFVVLAVMAAFAGRWNSKGRGAQIALTIAVAFCVGVVGWGSSQIAGITGPVDSIEAARSRGLIAWTIGSSFRTTEAAAVKIDATNVKSVQQEIDDLLGVEAERIEGAPATGVAKGKNVIVIQVEALQADIIGKEIDGQEITPYLNKLAGDSWLFSNVISQAGSGLTADAEFVVASSYFPPNGEPAAVTVADKIVPSLPRSLGEDGYKTTTMHVNNASFWNRTQLYPALGYESYYDRAYFGEDDVIYMGASDEVFFSKAMPLLEEMDGAKKPYYAHLVTITSHHPFPELPADKNPMPLPAEYQGTIAGRYIQDINYTDRAIGEFVDELEAKGLLDDTVLVIYGDHFGLKGKQAEAADTESVKKLFGPKYSHFEAIRIPMIVKIPGDKGGQTVDQLLAQSDISPTIADLLGISMANRPVFGATAFRGRADGVIPTTCLAPAGSFVTPEGEWRVGLGTKGASIKLNDGGDRKFEEKDAPLFERAAKLLALSNSYTASLPVRPFAGEVGKGAKLPPAAKRALKKREASESAQP